MVRHSTVSFADDMVFLHRKIFRTFFFFWKQAGLEFTVLPPPPKYWDCKACHHSQQRIKFLKILDPISKLSKAAGCTINMQKQIVCLYNNNEHVEIETFFAGTRV
jgi:hypothetical protein